MKIIILLFVLAIMVALFSGLFFLLKDKDQSKRTVKALSWRVGLQAALIVLLVVAVFMGWIQPHDVVPPSPDANEAIQSQN